MIGVSSHCVPLAALPSVGVSVVILLTLAVVLAGSGIMFWILARQSTDWRHSVAMREWAYERHLRFGESPDDPLPPPLDSVSGQRLSVRFSLAGKQFVLIRFESFAPAGTARPEDPRVHGGVWNLLIREIENDWPPTALRPTAAATSAWDLFSLSSFEMLGASERFVAYGTEPRAASALSRSHARGLLPADVGLLLHRRRLVLDFSTRPFDAIEFERMIAVAEQMVGHLPGTQ